MGNFGITMVQVYFGNPNGLVNANEGDVLSDPVDNILWQNEGPGFGSVWIDVSAGGGGSGEFTPTTILPGDTFSVPANSQALMRRRILVEAGGSIKIGANSVLISS